MAGSATLHEKFANQPDSTEMLPCADKTLLLPLKRSSEYRQIRPRVADIIPIDSWQELDYHFFVFQLKEAAEKSGVEAPVVVFAMHPQNQSPISVVVVTPNQNGEEAEVMDLREPSRAYTAPLPV